MQAATETRTSGNRLIHLDLLRILSIFAVVLLHTASGKLRDVSVASYAWTSFNFYDSLMRFCVPALVMISGVFFLNREIPLKKLYTKYILRIATAFVIWSAIYLAANLIVEASNGTPLDLSPKRLLRDFILAPPHLWFLYMIACLYIVTPFLRAIVADRQRALYFLILWFLIGVCFQTLSSLDGLKQFTSALRGKMNLVLVTGYSGYYVLGDYLSKTKIRTGTELAVYFLGALSAAFTVLSTQFLSLRADRLDDLFYKYMTPNVMMQTIAVFVLFQCRISRIVFSQRAARAISYVSACTFGIYLIHMIVKAAFVSIGFDTLLFNPFLSVPALAVAVSLVSFACVALLRMIPYFGRHLK